jgi:outer membrane beta-barrel protein
MKKLMMLLAVTALTLTPLTAFADDEPLDTGALDKSLDLFWGQNREVESIQRRLFNKVSRHEVTLFTGVIPNDEFYTYMPIGLRYDYFFTEDLAVELWGEYLFTFDSSLKDFLEENFRQTLLVDIPQSLIFMAGVNAVWSPIHGKFAIFTTKLAHFDMHITVGAGAVGTTVRKLDKEELSVNVAGNVGLGFRIYALDWLSVRFDYRQYFYAAEVGGVAKPAEFTMGVSFFTAAPE